jgi:hypothetical protein
LPVPAEGATLVACRDGPFPQTAELLEEDRMGEHADDREAVEFGGEAPTVEVLVYQHGALVHRELCESKAAAADLIEEWGELDGVECLVDDLAVKHRPGEILEPDDEEMLAEQEYPHAVGQPEG